MIVAGEASADLHGADLLKALREQLPFARFFGVGGRALAAEGLEVIVPADALNVVGVADWWDRAPAVLGAYRRVKKEALRRRPDAAVLLDLPDFNLRLSKHLKRAGIPVIYYISPQIWAWRKYRVRSIQKNIDKMLVVFPFEKAFYDAHGVNAEFVGHPLLDQVQTRSTYREAEQIKRAPRIALLPGSRPSELRHHAELIRDVARRLWDRYPQGTLRIPVASTLTAGQVRSFFPDPRIAVVEGDSRETLHWADIALVASGTATLETAMIGTPFALFYRLSPSTAWVVRHLIRYKRFFGMPNLLHGKEVAREFLHDAATPEALCQEAIRLIEEAPYRERVTRDLRECRARLGEGGASARAAQSVLRILKSQPARGGAFVPAPA